MLVARGIDSNTFVRCLGRRIELSKDLNLIAAFHTSAPLLQSDGSSQAYREDEGASRKGGQDVGAMSKRLSEMTEEHIEHGGRSARKAMDEAGFSEELKRRLEARIADSKFKSENPAAFAQLNMPVCAVKYQRTCYILTVE